MTEEASADASPGTAPPEDAAPKGATGSKDRVAALQAALTAAEERVDAAEKHAQDLKERLQRLAADFDNFRKRAKREAEEAGAEARESLLRELLVISDNFDRAFEAGGGDEDLYNGVRLIYKQFTSLLGQQGLERIDAVGHPFDPLLHEAVMREETDAYAEGVIIQEFERGYRFRGKVLRPAKVKVAAAPVSPPADATDTAGAPDEPADEAPDGGETPGEDAPVDDSEDQE